MTDDPIMVSRCHGDDSTITGRHLGGYNVVVFLPGCGPSVELPSWCY